MGREILRLAGLPAGRNMHLLLAGMLCVLSVKPPVHALEFDMLFQTKCVMEEINKNTLVVGEFSSFHKNNAAQLIFMDIKVEAPSGTVLYDQKGLQSGQFAFTTKEDGDFKACFSAKGLALLTQDWDAVAKKDHLSDMATELRRLEGTIREIHQEMVQMRSREEEMRNINEATNARIAWFSIGSLVMCVSLAAWQLIYLRRFFRKKKLL